MHGSENEKLIRVYLRQTDLSNLTDV